MSIRHNRVRAANFSWRNYRLQTRPSPGFTVVCTVLSSSSSSWQSPRSHALCEKVLPLRALLSRRASRNAVDNRRWEPASIVVTILSQLSARQRLIKFCRRRSPCDHRTSRPPLQGPEKPPRSHKVKRLPLQGCHPHNVAHIECELSNFLVFNWRKGPPLRKGSSPLRLALPEPECTSDERRSKVS